MQENQERTGIIPSAEGSNPPRRTAKQERVETTVYGIFKIFQFLVSLAVVIIAGWLVYAVFHLDGIIGFACTIITAFILYLPVALIFLILRGGLPDLPL